ncbi:MFS general substrate transporter [Mycena sanguinolenta]|uniref:MFS general substrate transporter n=1 Tax=Mycena sanguinolenta TaxID=230812 RepID=A0A8H6ZIR9_9AGAR|nr:MFS general substrate transporter [Mycena sanguinolenta]
MDLPDAPKDESARASTEITQDSVPTRSTWRSVLIVATTTLAMVTNIASSTAPSIFLPVIGRDLNIEEDQLQWLVSSFSLSSGCLLLLLGRLADLFGRKKFFLLGTGWLVIFSLGCGFAKNATTIYILRGLQGIGPAAFIPACLGILAHTFPPGRARSVAFATFSAGAPVGGTLGTQLGAVLVQKTDPTWRSPFFLFAGMAALCLIGGLLTIDSDIPTPDTDRRVDWIGAFLITVGLALLLFVLGQGQLAPNGWKTAYIIALLISEGKLRPPLMKLTLWTRANGRFAVIQTIAFLNWATFISWYFWLQVYFEDFLHLSPVRTAVRLLPMPVTGIMLNAIVALVIGRIPFFVLIALGTGFTGIGALLIAIMRPQVTYWAYDFVALVASVFGADFVFAGGTIFVAKVALPGEQSVAGGLFQTLTQLGTAFGLAITTIVHNAAGGEGVGDDVPLKAYRAAQWTCFGMAMLGTVLAIGFLRGVGPVGGPDEPPPEKDRDVPVPHET